MVSVTKLVFQEGCIPTALTCMMMVLITKGVGGYRGIGLVEFMWKVCMPIMNNRLRAAITLHDALHGFRQRRGVLTATMEAKLAHQLVGMVHEPISQVFLYVRKAYYSLDKGRCMEILRGYGLSPNLQRLLQRYCYKQAVVPKDGSLFGQPFRMERGVTQGIPLSPKIFNILVDAVVRAVLMELCGPREAHHRFGWAAGEQKIFFYVDNVRIAGRNPIWFQTTLIDMVRMFDRVGLLKNLGNTKAMV